MDDSRHKIYRDANRIAWDEAAARHGAVRTSQLLESFKRPGYNYLGEIETRVLTQQIGLRGKSVVQPACNNGREILSIRNLGAGRCVGFDISRAFIDEGRRLAAAGGIECELIDCDVYEIPAHYDAAFQICFISVGALMLFPDLISFFSIVARLLGPRADLFIYERHPILDMFDPRCKDDPPRIMESYFRNDPRRHDQVMNYWTREVYDSFPMYTFHHKMSDVINALLANGFRITWFEEFQHDISEMYAPFEKLSFPLPLCYGLTAAHDSQRVPPVQPV